MNSESEFADSVRSHETDDGDVISPDRALRIIRPSNILYKARLIRKSPMDVDRFLEYFRAQRNYSVQTIREREYHLRSVEIYLKERSLLRIKQVDHGVIKDYIDHLRQKGRFGRSGLSEPSIARRLAALSSYFEFLRETSSPNLRNPVKNFQPKWHKKCPPKPTDEKTLDSLLAGINDLRDRTLVTLFLASGLQIFEMAQLNRDTITIEEDIGVTGLPQVVGRGEVIGKGGEHTVFLVDEASLVAYVEYLASRTDGDPALFLSDQGHRMPVHTIHRTLASWYLNLGNVNIHRLGVSSLVLKELMSYPRASESQNDRF
jgi:site-specific recombinase XerD